MREGSDLGRGVIFVLVPSPPPPRPGAQSLAHPQQHPVFRQQYMVVNIRQQIKRPAPIDANATCQGTKHSNVSISVPALHSRDPNGTRPTSHSGTQEIPCGRVSPLVVFGQLPLDFCCHTEILSALVQESGAHANVSVSAPAKHVRIGVRCVLLLLEEEERRREAS